MCCESGVDLNDGKTLKEIADEYNTAPQTILRWMKRLNIRRRDSNASRRPSGLEKQFIQFLQKNGLEFKFVGSNASEKLDTSALSGVVWNSIYPDFKHETKKIAVEIEDKRHKTRMLKKIYNWMEWEKMRRKAYKKLGWMPIIVWEDEFSKNPKKVLTDIKTAISEYNWNDHL